MEQELSEIAVEVNSIFDNMSIDVLNKIPQNIRDFFKKNASTTYNFKYDKTKGLEEQNIKNRTKGVIALLYRNYICDEAERKEYDSIYLEFLNKKEEEKRALYNPDDIFKKAKIEEQKSIKEDGYRENEKIESLEITNNELGIIKKIINKIISFFKKIDF